MNYLISEEQSGGLSFEYVKSTLAEDTQDTKLYLGQELDDATQTMKDYPTLIFAKTSARFSNIFPLKESSRYMPRRSRLTSKSA